MFKNATSHSSRSFTHPLEGLQFGSIKNSPPHDSLFNLFFRQRLKADASSSFLLVNAFNRCAQFLFLLVLHYNSLVTSLVNMRAGVTIACDTIEQATFFLHRRACNYVPTNWSLFFGGHDAQKWKKITFGFGWRLACAWVVALGWLGLKFGSWKYSLLRVIFENLSMWPSGKL